MGWRIFAIPYQLTKQDDLFCEITFYRGIMLDIKPSRSKKGWRIQILRKYKDKNELGKVIYHYKHLGNVDFEDEPVPQEILSQLSEEELLELKNWLAQQQFAGDFFHVKIDSLTKHCFAIPEPFDEAIKTVYREAKQAGIDYSPDKIMLEALYEKTVLVADKVRRINGLKSPIIPFELKEKKEYDDESKILFKALVELNQSINITCQEFEEEAKKWGKNQHIAAHHLMEWSEKTKPSPQNRHVKKWCFTVAIDLLMKHRINPVTIIPLEKVVEYWTLAREPHYSFKEAKETFVKTFGIDKKDTPIVEKVILSIYQKF